MVKDEGESVAAQMRRLMAEGRISKVGLRALTGIEDAKLTALLDDKIGPTLMSEGLSLSMMAANLIVGLEIEDDERLQAMVHGFTDDGLTLGNLALLTGQSVADLTRALTDPGSLPSEAKYRLGMRLSYLVNARNQSHAALT